jgi:hypothetical protein
MLHHHSTRHAVAELRRQDLLAFAAQQRLADASGNVCTPRPARPWWRRFLQDDAELVGLGRFRVQPPRLAGTP